MAKPKVQARSSRIAVGNSSALAFGAGTAAGSGDSDRPPSTVSYYADLPDLSNVIYPAITVCFKGLFKRDSTTKARALEELEAYIAKRPQDFTDPVVEVWIGIYPRTSIDSERRVRQLAHVLHGKIAFVAGKRILKHLPACIGPWLLGLQDGDKAVATAAKTGLEKVFPSAEKRSMLLIAYQGPLLDFALNIIQHETPHTLSYEPAVGPAEAAAKYTRTLAATFRLLSQLFDDIGDDHKMKGIDKYRELADDQKLWANVASEDTSTRRSIHKLFGTYLDNPSLKSALVIGHLSSWYVIKGLECDQTGTAAEFLGSLVHLTGRDSSVWTSNWSGSKPAYAHLRHFLRKGSQTGQPAFWATLGMLLQCLPREAYPDVKDGVVTFLKAFQSGLTRKDEPRANLAPGVKEFLRCLPTVSNRLSPEEHEAVLVATLEPLVASLLFVTDERAWDVPQAIATDLLKHITSANFAPGVLIESWKRISDKLVTHITTLLPVETPGHDQSQLNVSSEAERWAHATSALCQSDAQHAMPEIISLVLMAAINVSRNRFGTSYGAAAAMAHITTACKDTVLTDPDTLAIVESFMVDILPHIFLSPSNVSLGLVLKSMNGTPVFQKSWTQCLATIVGPDNDIVPASEASSLFKALPKDHEVLYATCEADIRKMLHIYLNLALDGEQPWDAVLEILGAIDDYSLDTEFIGAMAEAVVQPERALSAMRGFREVFKRLPRTARSWGITDPAVDFCSNVLRLSEIQDDPELSQAANDVSGLIDSTLSGIASFNEDARVASLHRELIHASVDSVLVDTLARQADNILKDQQAHFREALIPNLSTWDKELRRFMERGDDYCIASPQVASILCTDQPHDLKNVGRDSTGLSVPLRMAMYTALLLSNVDSSTVTERTMATVLSLLVKTILLAEQKIGIENINVLWSPNTKKVEARMLEFISHGRQLVSRWLQTADWGLSDVSSATCDFVREAMAELFKNIDDPAPHGYFSLRALCYMTHELINTQGLSRLRAEMIADALAAARRSRDVRQQIVTLAAYNPALDSIKFAKRWFGEIVVDLTNGEFSIHDQARVNHLLLLQAVLTNRDSSFIEPAATQRLFILAKRLVTAVSIGSSAEHAALLLSILNVIIPRLIHALDKFWDDLLRYIAYKWNHIDDLRLEPNEPTLSLVCESLKVHATMMKMFNDADCNEELQDALCEREREIHTGLINLLFLERNVPDESHAPLRLVDTKLAHALAMDRPGCNSGMNSTATSTIARIKPEWKIYYMLSSNSESLQAIAFKMLHSLITEDVQVASIEIALSDKGLGFPDELQSLLLMAPTVGDLEELDVDDSLPLTVKSYFLSWTLVLDTLDKAPNIVRLRYLESLKEGDYLNPLLDFTFAYLGHAVGQPFAADHIDPESADIDYENLTGRVLQRLLVRLYYLALRCASSLVKVWWISRKSRVLSKSVESWTSKYISPLIIKSSLQAVHNWSKKQPEIDTTNGRPLTIKTNVTTRELVATYPVAGSGDDEEHLLSMVVRMPESFPLRQAEVSSGTARPPFEERRWKAWLQRAQAAIAFGNDSVVDGLVAWRRNVVDALDGRSECTICYCLVSEHGKLPTRRCATCKNSYHLTCLENWFSSSGKKECPLCRSEFENMART